MALAESCISSSHPRQVQLGEFRVDVAGDGDVDEEERVELAGSADFFHIGYDHHLVDGKEAVTFLIRIKDCLENPARLMLEM